MDNLDQDLKNLIMQLTTFDKLYQDVRIVQPVTKEVLKYTRDDFEVKEGKCYDMWPGNCICENCISMRALNEKDIFVKIEFADKKAYMITAIPTEIRNKRVVIELLKDVTKSMILGNDNNDMSIEIVNIITSANLVAIKDALTSIYNKRYIIERLPLEIALHNVEDKQLSIIMVDLDGFKEINDRYGHMAGDHILKEFAHILESSLGKDNDWASRFGGDEFLICLPDTGIEAALVLAEEMRIKVEKRNFQYNGQDIYLTASFGVYCLEKDKVKDMEKFIQYADRRLYKAKQHGKNRVES